MDLNHRIESFINLGNDLQGFIKGEKSGIDVEMFDSTLRRAETQNKWFTRENVITSIDAVSKWLTEESLVEWTSHYIKDFKSNKGGKIVGIIMAGNIPLVGFHDLLSVLITGNKCLVKTSTDDSVLIHFIVQRLIKIAPDFDSYITLTEGMLKDFDAVIATGSNNTSRYFEQYFSKYPNIIRKNRHSIAILTGDENEKDLKGLGTDIFKYFGLGCRNVSKLFVPKGYDFDAFFKIMMNFNVVGQNQKYINNVDYHKAILLVNRVKFLDGGTLLLTESDDLHSPVGVINYSEYENLDEVEEYLLEKDSEIQCVVGRDKTPFGKAQKPELLDYADNIDVLKFLFDFTNQ